MLGIDTGGTYTDGILMVYASREVVATQLRQEEERFARTLNAGTDVAGRVPDPLDLTGSRATDDAARWEQFQNEWYPPGFRALVKEYFETVTQRATEQE